MSKTIKRWYKTWLEGWYSGSFDRVEKAKQSSDGTRKEADKLKLLLAELRAQNVN